MSCELPPEVLPLHGGRGDGHTPGLPGAARPGVLLRRVFAEEDIYVDLEQLRHYLGLVKYFPYERLFPLGGIPPLPCGIAPTAPMGAPRWKKLLCMVGRGAGKDGFIAFDSACSLSPITRSKNTMWMFAPTTEEQAVTPVKDLSDALESPKWGIETAQALLPHERNGPGRAQQGHHEGPHQQPKGSGRYALRQGDLQRGPRL